MFLTNKIICHHFGSLISFSFFFFSLFFFFVKLCKTASLKKPKKKYIILFVHISMMLLICLANLNYMAIFLLKRETWMYRVKSADPALIFGKHCNATTIRSWTPGLIHNGHLFEDGSRVKIGRESQDSLSIWNWH